MTQIQFTTLIIVLSGLLLVAAKKTGVPQTLLLLVGGVLVGLILGVPRLELDPLVIFQILLPILLYSSAVTATFRLLRTNFWSSVVPNTFLLVLTTGVVAVAAHTAIPGMSWSAAVLFGTILASTDTNGAVEIGEQLKISRRIRERLKAEGMISPAILLTVGLISQEVGKTGEFSIISGAGQFFWEMIGGAAVGAAIGYLYVALRRSLDAAPIEIAISLSTPYAAGLAAGVLHVSPIVAVILAGFVVASLYLNKPDSGETAETRLLADTFWSQIKFILTGVLFFIIGLAFHSAREELMVRSIWTLVGYSFGFLSLALTLRWLTALAVARLRNSNQTGDKIAERSVGSVGEATLMTWSGARSAVSVAIALLIPATANTGEPFPARELILVLTCLIAFLSLLMQSTTLAWLIKKLGCADERAEELEEQAAQIALAKVGLQTINNFRIVADAHSEFVSRLQQHYERRLAQTQSEEKFGEQKNEKTKSSSSEFLQLRRATLAAENQVLIERYDRDALGDELFRRLQQKIDLERRCLEKEISAA